MQGPGSVDGGICSSSLSSALLLCAGMMDGNVKVQAAAINMLNFALAHPDTCTHVFKSAQVSAPEQQHGMQVRACQKECLHDAGTHQACLMVVCMY